MYQITYTSEGIVRSATGSESDTTAALTSLAKMIYGTIGITLDIKGMMYQAVQGNKPQVCNELNGDLLVLDWITNH